VDEQEGFGADLSPRTNKKQRYANVQKQ